jgi:hypothetical protein
MLPWLILACGQESSCPANTTILNATGLHAKDDLAKVNASALASCCDACAKYIGCVAWTKTGSICRLKGASSGAVPCAKCTSGILKPTPSPPTPAPGPKPADAKNVLMIVVDDLRPQMGCYGQKETLTPHLDRLAGVSLAFDRAYTQQSVCSPSRNSFMSGRRPDVTKAWNFKTHFREVGPTWLTMPQWFKNHGYITAGCGKLYHPNLPPQNVTITFQQTSHTHVYMGAHTFCRYLSPVCLCICQLSEFTSGSSKLDSAIQSTGANITWMPQMPQRRHGTQYNRHM